MSSDNKNTPNTPLTQLVANPVNLANPYNFAVFITFGSPLILSISMLVLSLVFQNFKGLIYIGFLLGSCVLRQFLFSLRDPVKNLNPKCSNTVYGAYGDSHISSFIFAFTLTYLSIPMFVYKSYNLSLFFGLISYAIFDIIIKHKELCVRTGELFINALLGFVLSAGFVAIMMNANTSSRNLLFFNELSSDKEVCAVAKNQTFKCSVYKNGELIGDM